MGRWQKNDQLIDQFLADPTYEVRPDGTIWASKPLSGPASPKKTYPWRRFDRFHEGYKIVSYFGNFLKAHRIVYKKFVGDLDPNLDMNHKDGNKTNNRPDNLELVTPYQNAQHAMQNGLFCVGSNMVNSKLTEDDALIIRLLSIRNNMTYYQIWQTGLFDVSHQTVKRVVDGKGWRHVVPTPEQLNGPPLLLSDPYNTV